MRQPIRSQGKFPRQQISAVKSYPSPVGGWNKRDSLAAMKPTDAVTLDNWYPRPSYCEIRGGSSDHGIGMTGNGKTLAVYNGLTGANKLFCATNSNVYDASSSGDLGVHSMLLPGTAGNYATTPDSVAASITGDIDIQAYIAPTNWVSTTTIAAKAVGAANQQSYKFQISLNRLGFIISQTGGSPLIPYASDALTFSAGAATWVRVTLDVNNGSGGSTATFYTSDDGVTWTQYGSSVTVASTIAIFDSTAPLEIGSWAAGTKEPFAGRIMRVRIYSGIAGTLKCDFNANDAAAGAGTVVSSTTLETYTLQGTAAIQSQNVVTGITNGKWQWVMMGNGTDNYLIMMNGADKPLYFDGATWVSVDAVSVPALTGVTTTTLIAPMVFKGRLIAIQKNTLSFWYLASGAVGGAMTEFDLSAVAKKGGYLMASASWTVDGGDGPDDRAVFITSEGEIIVYAGNNPSNSDAWVLVGVYELGKPLGRKCFTKYGGDLVLLTQNGAFPMAAALQSAAIDYKLALSFKIESAFTDTARSYGSVFGWTPIVFPAQSALIVNVPTAEDGTHYQYVMNTVTKSWCRFTDWDAEDFAVFNGELYFAAGTSVVRAWTGTSDNGAEIIAYGKQAFNYFGTPGQQKDFVMYRPVLAVNGTLNFLTDIDVDFQDTPITGSATYSVLSGALWDIDNWDESSWAAGLEVVKAWTSPDEYTGYCASGKVKISTNALTVQWMSSDMMMKMGGAL